MSKLIDLTGQRFGRFTIVSRAENKGKRVYWICICDCGIIIPVDSSSLRNGRTSSCGCFRKEKISKEKRKYNKDEVQTRLYKTWVNMKTRTTNTNTKDYRIYGERGITVCPEWRDDFRLFKQWAVENGYNDNLTIDRIENDKGYSPNNCRWVDRATQNANKRNNNNISYQGQTKNLSEWAKIVGIKREALKQRLKRGWSVEKALTTPIKNNKSNRQ